MVMMSLTGTFRGHGRMSSFFAPHVTRLRDMR
jgi:hypothetical protein